MRYSSAEDFSSRTNFVKHGEFCLLEEKARKIGLFFKNAEEPRGICQLTENDEWFNFGCLRVNPLTEAPPCVFSPFKKPPINAN